MRKTHRRTRAAVASLPVAALVAAALGAAPSAATAAAASPTVAPVEQAWINYAAPRAEKAVGDDVRPGQ